MRAFADQVTYNAYIVATQLRLALVYKANYNLSDSSEVVRLVLFL